MRPSRTPEECREAHLGYQGADVVPAGRIPVVVVAYLVDHRVDQQTFTLRGRAGERHLPPELLDRARGDRGAAAGIFRSGGDGQPYRTEGDGFLREPAYVPEFLGGVRLRVAPVSPDQAA